MKKRNRSPGLGVLALVATLMIGFPMAASGADETRVSAGERPMDLADGTTTQGVIAKARIMTERSAAASCQKGKRVIGTSSSFVVRAAIKSAGSNCYTCCADKIFFDNFETNDTSRWSSVVGD